MVSQVSLELLRSLDPRNAGMGSVMIVIAGSGETSPSFAKEPFFDSDGFTHVWSVCFGQMSALLYPRYLPFPT